MLSLLQKSSPGLVMVVDPVIQLPLSKGDEPLDSTAKLTFKLTAAAVLRLDPIKVKIANIPIKERIFLNVYFIFYLFIY